MSVKIPRRYPKWTPEGIKTLIEVLQKNPDFFGFPPGSLEIVIRLATYPNMERIWKLSGAFEYEKPVIKFAHAICRTALILPPIEKLKKREREHHIDNVKNSAKSLYKSLTALGLPDRLDAYMTEDEFDALMCSTLDESEAKKYQEQNYSPGLPSKKETQLLSSLPEITAILKKLSNKDFLNKLLPPTYLNSPNTGTPQVTYFIRCSSAFARRTIGMPMDQIIADIAQTTFDDVTIDRDRVRGALRNFDIPKK